MRCLRTAVVIALTLAAPAAVASRPAAYVRVDQIGYAPAAPKRAYLLSSVRQSGTAFQVTDWAGRTVLSGTVGSPIGSWSRGFPYVYAFDISSLSVPGSYTIVVGGPAPTASPRFAIEGAGRLYGAPLRNALAFYQVQRDGPNFIRSALRTAPAHLGDEHASLYLPPKTDESGAFTGDLSRLPGQIDASGGWWDAGDYLKFVQTTSYTVDLMLAGIRSFPAQMGMFSGEAKFGLSWLLRMWNDRTRTLYFQVGIGTGNATTIGDHDIWRLPQADDGYGGGSYLYRYIRRRPVFRAGPPGSAISPNLAGRDAAAFGLCFQVFSSSDPALAAQCLRAGEHIFALANVHPRALLTAIPYGFYPETEWRDDLELGATELAGALSRGHLPRGLPHTSPGYYLTQAADWARQYMRQPDEATDPLNLYDVSGLAHYELYRAIVRRVGSRLAVTPGMLLADMRHQLEGGVYQARRDPFGFGWPWNGWDSTSHGLGLSVLAGEYDQLAHSTAYRSWSVRWLDDVLGANAWGASFIIGDGGRFPRCPQHQVATLAGSPNGSGAVLAGAVVEGPTDSATSGIVEGMRLCPLDGSDPYAAFNGPGVYTDNVQSYSTDEPAIDLTASSPLAFSWQIASGGA